MWVGRIILNKHWSEAQSSLPTLPSFPQCHQKFSSSSVMPAFLLVCGTDLYLQLNLYLPTFRKKNTPRLTQWLSPAVPYFSLSFHTVLGSHVVYCFAILSLFSATCHLLWHCSDPQDTASVRTRRLASPAVPCLSPSFLPSTRWHSALTTPPSAAFLLLELPLPPEVVEPGRSALL